jgi:pimeloyl-ACP methyl ester carboxylesterase
MLKKVHARWALAFGFVAAVLLDAASAGEAVNAVAPNRFTVTVARGSGQLALYTEGDLNAPQPAVIRAIVVFHGLHRDAEGYLHDVERARTEAGAARENTLLIAPQFLNHEDARAHKLSGDVLRWERNQWEAGEPAIKPAAISSYDAIDAILTRLADRRLFPNLREVVLAGHSGGGQIVQRYAVAGHAIAAVEKTGIALRYVVANPSSYLYFDSYRPVAVVAHGCRQFNTWKFGLSVTPRYLGSPDSRALETAYIARRVIYLLGTADDDPNGPDIDQSCAAEAQGPTRWQRGINYFRYLESRHGAALAHRVLPVPGVAHNARKMFTSTCGIDALFDTGGCKPSRVE